jgi:hypothetical protein
MIQRMTIACVFLILVGSTFAQPPSEVTPIAPPLSDQGPLSSLMVMPTGWSMPDGRFWVSGDYLFSFVRGSRLPALVTTSDAGTAKIDAGVLGAPSTTTLFGDRWVNDDLRSGFRLTTGYWFNAERTLGIEAGFMILEGQSTNYDSGNNYAILARPFTNANNSVPTAQLVAFPGSSAGSVNANVSSHNFYETHIDLTEQAIDDGWYRLTSMFGYRYYRYDESIRIRQALTTTDPNFAAGTQAFTSDSFSTRNEFHGLDIGFRSQFFWENLTLDVLTKVAAGRLSRTITIDGNQVVTAPGAAPVVQSGGLLAPGSSNASFGSGDWKVMPEAGVMLSWQIRPNLSARMGYSFMLLNGVARAADQIDTTINPNLLPGANAALGGPIRPTANTIRTDMWIQSINFGVQWTY